jgi:hypothetical protein
MLAPPTGFAKIHVDAGLSRSCIEGTVAAVCRDSERNYLGSSSLVIHGVRDVATLEAIAFREELALADDLLHNVMVSTDSKRVASDILNGSSGNHGQIIAEIRLRAQEFKYNYHFEGGHQIVNPIC